MARNSFLKKCLNQLPVGFLLSVPRQFLCFCSTFFLYISWFICDVRFEITSGSLPFLLEPQGGCARAHGITLVLSFIFLLAQNFTGSASPRYSDSICS